MYPFFYFQVDSLRHGLGDSFAFYSVRPTFLHCELVGLTVDHSVGHHQCGQFRRSLRCWHRAPVRRCHRPDDHHNYRMRYLDYRYDLARFSGQCRRAGGAVWLVLWDE